MKPYDGSRKAADSFFNGCGCLAVIFLVGFAGAYCAFLVWSR